MPSEINYRPREMGKSKVVPSAAPAYKCWMIKWENVPYLFVSLDRARESIELTYPDCTVEVSVAGEFIKVLDVMLDSRIQDRVTVIEVGVLDGPVALPGRRVTPAEF